MAPAWAAATAAEAMMTWKYAHCYYPMVGVRRGARLCSTGFNGNGEHTSRETPKLKYLCEHFCLSWNSPFCEELNRTLFLYTIRKDSGLGHTRNTTTPLTFIKSGMETLNELVEDRRFGLESRNQRKRKAH